MTAADTQDIETYMRQSVETITVHDAILHDDTAWAWIQDEVRRVLALRITKSGHTLDHQALIFDLANRIEKYLKTMKPAFQAEIWNSMIDYFMFAVDWYSIATWHFVNMWECGIVEDIDGWLESPADTTEEV